VQTPDEFVLLPGAARAVHRLNRAGLRVLVVTNQRGIALARLTHGDLSAIHARMGELLERDAKAHVDGIFYCPHEIGECSCRKPGTGLFLQAAERWADLDLRASAMIGDSQSDIAAAQKLGMSAIQVGGAVPDLSAAVDLLLTDAPTS
jgi:D-glycero-D-manno-heptose 1,7-bisphosphate phosphatase